MHEFPWDSVIPTEDFDSFRVTRSSLSRPLQLGNKQALVVVDMTREFVDSAYPSGWSATGDPAVEKISELLSLARGRDIPIFFSKKRAGDSREATAAERGLWKVFREDDAAEEALSGGDEIVAQLEPQANEIIIHKGWKPSAFFETQLASLLVYYRVDTIIVTGMTTSGCVRATVVDAFQHNFNVVVPHECVADRSQISHLVTLFDLHMKYADVVSTQELRAALTRT